MEWPSHVPSESDFLLAASTESNKQTSENIMLGRCLYREAVK